MKQLFFTCPLNNGTLSFWLTLCLCIVSSLIPPSPFPGACCILVLLEDFSHSSSSSQFLPLIPSLFLQCFDPRDTPHSNFQPLFSSPYIPGVFQSPPASIHPVFLPLPLCLVLISAIPLCSMKGNTGAMYCHWSLCQTASYSCF